ncbi:MAG: hypothetical protein V3W20_13500 [Candidatus Neomarinimicrobiota bacterium]
MSDRTYSTCPNGHPMFFDPDRECSLRHWWCEKCKKDFKLNHQEKKLVMITYKYGRKCGKEEAIRAIKNALDIYP